jgi:hypothetical protein
MSQSELVWKPPPETVVAPAALMDALRGTDRADDANQQRIAVLLHRLCKENASVLGLAPDVPIAVRSFHHAVRLLGAELEHAQDIVCEVIQTTTAPVSRRSKVTVPVRGGTTLVIQNDGRLRYAIAKELHARRRRAQVDYATGRHAPSAALYDSSAADLDLQALHRGY